MMAARRFAPLIVVIVLGIAAAPAHATLLVRSDGAGLFVGDKNGLSDFVSVSATTLGGLPAYEIHNGTVGEIFKFDVQSGCENTDSIFIAKCQRNGPIMSIQLAGGNDSLEMRGSGTPPPPTGQSSVAGGTGNDTVHGHPGKDSLHGQDGEDALFGEAGNDTLDGGGGGDRLEGGDGNDELLARGGSDVLTGGPGTDSLSASQGNDFVNSREPGGTKAVADTVNCGSGSDSLEADLKDVVSEPGSCEVMDIAAVGETPNVKILGKALRVSPGGEVKVRMRCPRGVKKLGCNGSLRLRLDRKRGSQASRSRKVRYSIKAGRRTTVTLGLTAKDVSTLRTRQRRGRKTRGVLTSLEKGRKGRKTTVRNPRLKLRGG